jgi:ribonuclease MRP protein subunit RMP1
MSKPLQSRTPTKDDLAQLAHFSTLLHLLHHRNQNQHRRSTWYRHFSLFRRHLTALLADYTTLSTPPTTNVERTRLKALTPNLHTRISARLTFWQDVLVARWMRAFSQVVADGRFSVLGLVMLGVLGGVCRVVGVVDGLEAEGQAEIERLL